MPEAGEGVGSDCLMGTEFVWEDVRSGEAVLSTTDLCTGNRLRWLDVMCNFFLFVFCFFLFRAAPTAQGGPQARGPIRAVATGRPRPQPQPCKLPATPATYTTERGQGLNSSPHGCQLGLITTELQRELL